MIRLHSQLLCRFTIRARYASNCGIFTRSNIKLTMADETRSNRVLIWPLCSSQNRSCTVTEHDCVARHGSDRCLHSAIRGNLRCRSSSCINDSSIIRYYDICKSCGDSLFDSGIDCGLDCSLFCSSLCSGSFCDHSINDRLFDKGVSDCLIDCSLLCSDG